MQGKFIWLPILHAGAIKENLFLSNKQFRESTCFFLSSLDILDGSLMRGPKLKILLKTLRLMDSKDLVTQVS